MEDRARSRRSDRLLTTRPLPSWPRIIGILSCRWTARAQDHWPGSWGPAGHPQWVGPGQQGILL